MASTTAVYQCLEPIVRRIPVGAVKYEFAILSYTFTEIRFSFFFPLECLVVTGDLYALTLKFVNLFCLSALWLSQHVGSYTAKKNSPGYCRIYLASLSGMQMGSSNSNTYVYLIAFCFSVNMIRQVRLPSLKICTLLLVLLFFYDIFFVFITPLFTKVMALRLVASQTHSRTLRF